MLCLRICCCFREYATSARPGPLQERVRAVFSLVRVPGYPSGRRLLHVHVHVLLRSGTGTAAACAVAVAVCVLAVAVVLSVVHVRGVSGLLTQSLEEPAANGVREGGVLVLELPRYPRRGHVSVSVSVGLLVLVLGLL